MRYGSILAIGTNILQTVHAIPERATNLPRDIQHTNSIITLVEPTESILTLDALCAHIYAPWWTRALRWRLTLQQEMMLHPRGHADSIVPLIFTYYAETDVPVQGVWAKTADVTLLPGWRYERYSCLGTCQDIRLTIEWMLSAVLDGHPQKRTRSSVGLACPRGYKSRTTQVRTRREFATTAEEHAALTLLVASQQSNWPYTSFNPDSPEIKGDTNLIVTGCECVPMTEEETEAFQENLGRLRLAQMERAAKKRARVGELETQSTRRRGSTEPEQIEAQETAAASTILNAARSEVTTTVAKHARKIDSRNSARPIDLTQTGGVYCYDVNPVQPRLDSYDPQTHYRSGFQDTSSSRIFPHLQARLATAVEYQPLPQHDRSLFGSFTNVKHSRV